MSLMARCLLIFCLSINAFALDQEKLVSAFHERFEVVKENGKTVRILDRFVFRRNSILGRT